MTIDNTASRPSQLDVAFGAGGRKRDYADD